MAQSDGNRDNQSERPNRRPGVLKVMQSILAGAFGVQSNRRREEDFGSGSPLPYLVGGILFTLIFVIGVALIVRWVLSTQA
ncbi:DUF2970 domain-containing protein [Marinobacter bohaiensis]|uniref:DUF2970 domain-containing protein n=2 Tax=Marinobacter TaxID=2742 RepID=UPI000DAE7E8D|nr:DUF2970 domain-containing protein [Marinobacter bohaiensis]